MEQSARHILYENPSQLSGLSSGIIRALLYFDVFRYPLTLDEITENCGIPSSAAAINHETEQLLKDNIIVRTGLFYHLADRESIVPLRLELNERATGLYPKAKKFSKIISRFPFVEGILITGSLAKGCMDVDGDIDYFIITTPGRLWLCRGLLTAFKKIFLLNSRKYFCVNYYVSTDSLAIPDENIFTATEIIFAIPTYNLSMAEKFRDSNKWIYDHYPNKQGPDLSLMNKTGPFMFKSMLEKISGGWIGDKMDAFFFKLFVWRWRNKFKGLDAGTFDINFRSQKNVSKHHPHGFQLKVLSEYKRRIKKFESDHGLSLSDAPC